MELLLLGLITIAFCNWNQFGHDPQLTFRTEFVPKSRETWQRQASAEYPAPFIIDDNNGMLWYIYRQFPRPSGGNYSVLLVDNEGRTKFNSTIRTTNWYDGPTTESGYDPVLTKEGILLYWSVDDKTFYSVNPDGTTGKYSFNIPKREDTYPPFFGISESCDLFVVAGSNGLYERNYILVFNLQSEKLQYTINVTNETNWDLGFMSIVDETVYFVYSITKPWSESNTRLFSLNLETGILTPVFEFQGYFGDSISSSKDSDLLFIRGGIYSTNTIFSMSNNGKKKIWNYTFTDGHATAGMDYYVPVVIDENRLLIDYYESETSYFISIVDPKSGKTIKIFTVDDAKWCKHRTLMKEDAMLMICQIGSPEYQGANAIIKIDLLTGNNTVVLNSKAELSRVIGDSSGCFYYDTVHHFPYYYGKVCLD